MNGRRHSQVCDPTSRAWHCSTASGGFLTFSAFYNYSPGTAVWPGDQTGPTIRHPGLAASLGTITAPELTQTLLQQVEKLLTEGSVR